MDSSIFVLGIGGVPQYPILSIGGCTSHTSQPCVVSVSRSGPSLRARPGTEDSAGPRPSGRATAATRRARRTLAQRGTGARLWSRVQFVLFELKNKLAAGFHSGHL